MTWYRVGLWPGAGYTLESATVEAFSPEDALSEAVVSKGIGFTISSDEYEEMIDELVRIDGYSRRDAEWAVDESYTWIDPPGRYLLMDNFYLNEATPEDMLLIEDVDFELKNGDNWKRLHFDTGEDMREALYGELSDYLKCKVGQVWIEGETYLFGYGHTLEELMDELRLSDADQIASRNSKHKAKKKWR